MKKMVVLALSGSLFLSNGASANCRAPRVQREKFVVREVSKPIQFDCLDIGYKKTGTKFQTKMVSATLVDSKGKIRKAVVEQSLIAGKKNIDADLTSACCEYADAAECNSKGEPIQQWIVTDKHRASCALHQESFISGLH